MNERNVITSSTDIDLHSAPINPNWVLEGNPQARNQMIFKSHDGTASTVIWDCTPGKFNWFYDCDETAQILEGEVSLTTEMGTRAVRAGEAIFFPCGSWATWRVDTYVRKVAFLRQTLPLPAGLALRIWKRVANSLPRSAGTASERGTFALKPDPSSKISANHRHEVS